MPIFVTEKSMSKCMLQWFVDLPHFMHVVRLSFSVTYTCKIDVQISPEGIATRDEKVFLFAGKKKIPLLMLTSGF